MVMKIYCDYCKQTWEVYAHDDALRPSARSCPHCGKAKIREETWKEMVHCMDHVEMINRMLYSDHVNQHNPVFAVSYKADTPFDCAEKFSDV